MDWHKTEIRVRYQETDRMGVVYYANHFVWFEIARSEFFRDAGLPYRKLEDETGVRFMVVEASCQYKAPLTYDDIAVVETRISEIKKTSMSFEYRVSCSGRLAAEGRTGHVFTDKEGKPVKIPEKLKKALFSEHATRLSSP